MLSTPYNAEFFAGQRNDSLSSARVVVPHLLQLCNPRSVADFGSGVGTWLSAFRELGVEDITGVDGDYVQTEELLIPSNCFHRADLTQPIDLKRRFDLVVSVEVAEHLAENCAATFVDTLTRHGGVILFSAAIPGQRGTSHINERWPTYWQELFQSRGHECIDCLRDIFWTDERISWWYRQNMLLFVSKDLLPSLPALQRERERPKRMPLSIVHPGCIENIVREDQNKLLDTPAAKIGRRLRAFGARAVRGKTPA